MKKLILSLACLAAVTCQAQRIETFVVRGSVRNEAGVIECRDMTNAPVVIATGEAVRVGAVKPEPYLEREESLVQVWKGGAEFFVDKGDVIAGPAVFTMRSYDCDDALLTLEWLPLAVDPGRTLIVPQGSNAVAVAMEWSTNLVSWTIATNGVYSAPDAARFFRVKATPPLP